MQATGDWKSTYKFWQDAIALDPAHAGSWVQLGNMLNELERHKEAISAFARAGKLEPLLADVPAGIAGVHERTKSWGDALVAWRRAIALIQRPSDNRAPDQLAHALAHAVMVARLAGQSVEADELLQQAKRFIPDFERQEAYFLLRAQALKDKDPAYALTLLYGYLRNNPTDTACRYEIASITLRTGDYEAGLAALAPTLSSGEALISYRWLAADLNERLLRWPTVMVLSEHMAALEPENSRYLERAFAAAAAIPDLVAARRLACAYAVTHDELVLIHRLMQLYEKADELVRARLLCRWLCRRWPHSRWHVGRYIQLTAVTRSLSEADRLVRVEIEAGRRDRDIETAYCKSAQYSGDHGEARRRLEAYLADHPNNQDMQALLGYVLANTAGIDVAEQYFADLASQTFQSEAPLIGLAHMAMRRRDMPATFDRWAKLIALYPDHTIGFVEYARAAYEMREPALARRICEQRLSELPTDVTMGEFYAWLLAAIGSFGQAWDYLRGLRHRTGPSWAVVDLSIQCAATVGELDISIDEILASMPTATSRAAARRFYHVVRQLVCADRPDLLPALVGRINLPTQYLPWLAPYLDSQATEPVTELATKVRASWNHIQALVSDDTARRLRAMTDPEVDALLARPLHEQPTVHLVNKFEQMRGGSELHALDVAARIARFSKVRLWAPEMPHPHFSADHGVRAVGLGPGAFPEGGVLVLIGVYFEIDSWVGRTRPDRVLILYNTFEAPLLYERIAAIHARTGVRPELIFCSNMMQSECGLPGQFEPSPIDVDLFTPSDATSSIKRPFTLGRHSRDVVEKHHPEDWRIYTAVAEGGGISRLLGGTCMRPVFPQVPSTEFLSARNSGIPAFLQGLDAYVYRTSTWVEPWGRVVIEAMACGLPVLAHDRGGYAQAIHHERNGLLFHTTEEAVQLVRRLASDPKLRARLGAEARRDAATMLDGVAMARLVGFYLA